MNAFDNPHLSQAQGEHRWLKFLSRTCEGHHVLPRVQFWVELKYKTIIGNGTEAFWRKGWCNSLDELQCRCTKMMLKRWQDGFSGKGEVTSHLLNNKSGQGCPHLNHVENWGSNKNLTESNSSLSTITFSPCFFWVKFYETRIVVAICLPEGATGGHMVWA